MAWFTTSVIILFIHFLCFLIYNYLYLPPKELRHLPRASIPYSIWLMLFSGKSSVEQAKEFQRLCKQANGDGLIMVWFLTSWFVMILDEPALAKEIVSQPNIYKKFKRATGGKKSFIDRMFYPKNIVSSDGEEWRKHRRIINPAFHQKIDENSIGQIVEKVVEKLKQTKAPVRIEKWMQRLTLDVFGCLIFGYDFNSIENPASEPVLKYEKMVSLFGHPILALFSWLGYLPFIPFVKAKIEIIDSFYGMLTGIIKEKQNEIANNNESKDILSLMIQSSLKDENGLTERELMADSFVFFLAGHDTTANALSCALFSIAKHPSVQEKLRKEILAACPSGIPSADDLKQMPYLASVLKETLRLYPSASALTRRVEENTRLGKFTLPKGTNIIVSIAGIHRCSKIWDSPDDFYPERFMAPDKQLMEYSYFPFGGGSRICVGQNFSLLEQKISLAILARNFSVELIDENQQLEFRRGSGLMFPSKLELVFKKV